MNRNRSRSRGGAGAPIGVFSPLSISGLSLWLDPLDPPTILSSGGAVSQWTDKSINGYLATQGTIGNRPSTGTRTENGNNIIDLDGSGDRLSLNGPFSVSAGDNTIFIVAVCDVTSGNQRLLRGTAGSDFNDSYGGISYNAGTGSSLFRNGGFNASVTLTNKTAVHVYTIIRSGSTVTPYLNGVVGTSAAASNVTIDQLTIGGYSASNGAESWNGGIGDIIIYNRALSVSELNQVAGFLETRWGVAVADFF